MRKEEKEESKNQIIDRGGKERVGKVFQQLPFHLDRSLVALLFGEEKKKAKVSD